MKKLKLLYLPIAIAFFFSCEEEDVKRTDCSNDPCANPKICGDLCPTLDGSIITKNDIKAEGNVIEYGDSTYIYGKLSINMMDEEAVVLEDAEVIILYNEDGSVKSMEGTANVPSPADYIEITDPVQADFNYYSGKYLNENWDLDILLMDERFYIAFKFALTLEMKVGANSDSTATKPLTIKPPAGGHIIYIFDYTDPFYFISAAQDLLGSMCFGESLQGNIPYVPTQPVEEIVTFNGSSIRCGKFPIFKVIEATGVMIQGPSFNIELVEEDPFPLSFSAGYGAGINGEFNLSLPIKSWISFEIPLGEASAAITTEAGTEGVKAEAFINGLAKPDNSWWPTFVPIKPGGQIRTSGYIQQEGQFDLELSGAFNLDLPTKSYVFEGGMGATNESATMSGSVLANDIKWAADVEFRSGETEFKATPPQELLDDIDYLVNENIDSAFTRAENALAELEEAIENYEFELSLRGLREEIPTIVSIAKQRIAEEIDAGIASGRSQANAILSDHSLALCGDNIESQVKKLDDPYIAALDRLNNAALETNDNDYTRQEIEGALRDLAKLNYLNKSVTVTVTAGNKRVNNPSPIPDVPACSIFKNDYTRTVSVSVEILTPEQVALLNKAADNVKYIAETSNIMIKAEDVYNSIPSKEILAQLKEDIQSGAKTVPAIEEVGFINHHDDDTYSFYWVVDGEKKDLSDVNIFDPNSISEAIIGDLL